MPILNQADWKEWEESNQDEYGKACVDVARKVMELLDDGRQDFDPRQLICDADKAVDTGGITGFMVGCVAQIVSACHSRGEEFRLKWNKRHGVGEEKKGVVNPAIMTLGS